MPFVMQVYAHSGAYTCFLLHRKEYVTKTGGIDMTTETKFWKKKYFTMLAGQSVSLITSGILQMSLYSISQQKQIPLWSYPLQP